eukprot:184054-Amphidinium_carterae.1
MEMACCSSWVSGGVMLLKCRSVEVHWPLRWPKMHSRSAPPQLGSPSGFRWRFVTLGTSKILN